MSSDRRRGTPKCSETVESESVDRVDSSEAARLARRKTGALLHARPRTGSSCLSFLARSLSSSRASSRCISTKLATFRRVWIDTPLLLVCDQMESSLLLLYASTLPAPSSRCLGVMSPYNRLESLSCLYQPPGSDVEGTKRPAR